MAEPQSSRRPSARLRARSWLPLLAPVALLCTLHCAGGGGYEGGEPEPAGRAPTEWSQWRGAARDAVIRGFIEPDPWPDQLELVWSVEVGAGYSSPISSGSKIFVHTRHRESEVVSALDFYSGRTLWSDSYSVPSSKTPEFAEIEGEGPYSTPTFDSGRLYTVGVTGIVSAYQADSGELVWRRDFSDLIVETQRFCGVAPSPLLVDDRLIVHIGDDDSGELLALAPDSGETLWSSSGPAPGNASPITANIDDLRQIVTMTDEGVVGVDIAGGGLLWQHPFPGVQGSCSTNIPTPVVSGNSIIVAGMGSGTVAIEVSRTEGQWATRSLWSNEETEPLWSNYALADGRLYGISRQRKGQLVSLDVGTGDVLWSSEGRSGENGFVVVAEGVVLFLMNDAELRVGRPTDSGLEIETSYTTGDATVWSYPIVKNEGILVKAGSTLTLWAFD